MQQALREIAARQAHCIKEQRAASTDTKYLAPCQGQQECKQAIRTADPRDPTVSMAEGHVVLVAAIGAAVLTADGRSGLSAFSS
mmetsp:Transcript_108776/g.216028  ORF Transcript_108776/g.216028 Transcript_108776/m.216028 type:complete len:84 (+) Transcript_108776:62-313(+)|eukprot:CAMPEP_0172884912 /NCGR_PEP_ID=MMETSP1075-20121228/126488_1 /TAXON_ID=2916 /ORGANISM="Ceratium fusus, Strain PA161109" /LENGTH=83 /DNA_ID=CAMNT_0013738087 /DNA_START=72 /DNA_END=323 /DNA_ORIENTATION=-